MFIRPEISWCRREKYIVVAVSLLFPVLCLMMIGCPDKEPPKKSPLILLSDGAYPEFRDDLFFEGLSESIQQSLIYLKRIPADRVFSFGEAKVDAGHMIRSLETFVSFIETKPDTDALNRFIRERYQVYQSSGEEKTQKVLFTGYYEPLIKGSRYQSGRKRYPLYGPPNDLSAVDLGAFSSKLKGQKIIGRVEGKTFIPYFDREAIAEKDALKGRAEVLAWVEDPVDLFFLQIQGSGKILLEDGRYLNVHYHSKNGRPYRSIGQLLIDEKKVPREKMSMQAIRHYLKENPEDVSHVLNHNPSYVFFSVEKDGPYGAINVRLTAGRSIAVDRSVFPLAALSFIQVKKPVIDASDPGKITEWVDFSRFVMNQDTGGAIKSPGRADIFWGNGPYAETAAGHLKHRGNLFVLVLKE